MNKDRIMAYIDNQSEIKKCVETQFPFLSHMNIIVFMNCWKKDSSLAHFLK